MEDAKWKANRRRNHPSSGVKDCRLPDDDSHTQGRGTKAGRRMVVKAPETEQSEKVPKLEKPWKLGPVKSSEIFFCIVP